MNSKLLVTGFVSMLGVAVAACGSSSSGGGGGGSDGAGGSSAGGSSSTGAGGGTVGMHSCADLAACCVLSTFPMEKISQCQKIATGGNEAGCNSLYNGYQLLMECP